MRALAVLAKLPWMGLLERNGEVRAHVVNGVGAAQLQPHIRQHVEQGANLYTDKWVAYKHLDQEYIHGVINHAEKYVDGQIHTNSIENFWSLLKRTI